MFWLGIYRIDASQATLPNAVTDPDMRKVLMQGIDVDADNFPSLTQVCEVYTPEEYPDASNQSLPKTLIGECGVRNSALWAAVMVVIHGDGLLLDYIKISIGHHWKLKAMSVMLLSQRAPLLSSLNLGRATVDSQLCRCWNESGPTPQ